MLHTGSKAQRQNRRSDFGRTKCARRAGNRMLPVNRAIPVCNMSADPSRDRNVRLIQLDLDIHAGWKLQLHQGVDRLVRGVDNIHQPLVGPNFVLVPCILVDMR